ncbi:N-acyl homoserine lactonase family protein [Orrella marina]|uniref:N-acyl homoserine lactonase family protein n=1 Tax=Orrella marina TaxID=2163011 RepID=UPI001D131C1D|nr:N-acyl homoserine lactonase family protein [Orrella marina]
MGHDLKADLPVYEIFALRYAQIEERRRNENFIAHDPHDGPMPMDYFVWVIRNQERTILVDTGFSERAAKARKRKLLRCPVESLKLLGIDPVTVEDVIITHLHYDHAGNIHKLPNAHFHIQEDEMHYACGHHMCQGLFRHAYDVEDVVELVRRVYAERVLFYQGDQTLAPGIELVLVGGHTKGLQSVRVHTERGWVVLASDASHYYDNMMNISPFPIVYHVGDMVDGYAKLKRLAASEDHIIPGHDPQVRKRYPFEGLPENDIVKLHVAPNMR